MSGKWSNLFDDPPTASSSSEEYDVEENGNSSSEDESSKPESVLDAAEKDHVSDSESGSEEESDPVKKHPGPVAAAAKKKRSSSSGGEAASTDAKRVKRVSGEDEKKSSGGGEETKKAYFQRVWSEEDEIAVLQRIIDYKTDNGVSPLDDVNAFYLLLKNSISFDVSKTQFTEKLRSLKKKFEKNSLGKGKNGEEPTFSKPHDRKAFDLCKFIWGANGIAPESAPKSNGKSKKIGSKSEKVKQEVVSSLPNGKSCEDEEMANKGEVSSLGMSELDATFMKSFLAKSLARIGVDDIAAQQGWTRLASEDKKRFEQQWEAMQLREFEIYSQRSGFIHEVVTKMAEAFRQNP